MTALPTSTEDGAIWMTGKTLNELSLCIEERTVRIAPRWSRIIVLTEKKDGLELELDINELLKEWGEDVYFVRDGVACKAKFLISKDVQLV